MREKGYTDANDTSQVFEGTGHNEKAWAERLEIPLLSLIGKREGVAVRGLLGEYSIVGT